MSQSRKDKDKDSFIGPQEFVVGYSKAPEQLQSSARPICHSHTMTSTGREPATIRIAAYRSLRHYALRHRRRPCNAQHRNVSENVKRNCLACVTTSLHHCVACHCMYM